MSGHGPVAGPGGFFKRLPDHHLLRLVSFVSRENYPAKWDFHRAVATSVATNWPRVFAEKLAAALKTAKR